MNAKYAEFQAVFDEARREGLAAGVQAAPQPMMVVEHSNPLDDASAPKRAWHVPEGACGFAWVNIRPGTSPFARWLVKNGHARKAYYGGVEIWIREHGQSVERKEAHAHKMAAIFRDKLGVNAGAGSRLD